ncbi:hypothetical protein BDA99DRAFT_495963 [Phascolomyces articulosus]|uniref:rRNA-processing protein FYV7 n=1 Tax=Phascolomyces articulosus TaxID=60185 RepID=A0AAD5K9I9_9FUNG|nr:hypothetical protein BDA99DRAFT_495963 [Phascolomyces articulosus]
MMPPKGQKRGGRPLNPLERKVRKRKHELIHKATVKKQYYKSIEKENPQDDTPDYVKEIFGERTIDEDGNVVAYDSGKKDSAFEEEKEQDRVYYLDDASSSDEEEDDEEEDDDDDKGKRSKKKSKMNSESKQHKPNPFKSQIDDRNKARKLTQEQRDKRDRDFAQQAKDRQQYYSKRRRERSQMLAKNSKGQPKMAKQMDHLLEKIQKQMNA